MREWVTKEITRTRTIWERKFIPFGGGKIASPTRSLLLQLGAILGFTLSAALLLTLCAAPVDVDPTPVPTANATAIHETAIACAWIDATNTAVAATQTAMAGMPTPVPMTTPTPFQFPANKIFTANDQIFTCNDVALYFGAELNALLNANPGLNCNAVNIGVTQFNIPPLTLKSPDEYVSQYNCVPSTGQVCLSPNASVEEMIAYTLFNEGGSSEGNQFSADVMQVILNRANKMLDNWGIDRSQLSRDDYARMVLYVISKPAASGANAAAFEAFSSPSEPPAGDSQNWNSALQLAQAALDNKEQNWDSNLPDTLKPKGYIQNQDVLFYCSVRTPESPPLGFAGRLPEQGTGFNNVVTFFFNGYQYNQSVAQWCQDNR